MIIHSILSKIKKKILPPCLQGNYRNTFGELSYNFFYYFCFFFRQREALKNAVESFQDERNLHIEQYEKQQKVGTCSRGGRGWGCLVCIAFLVLSRLVLRVHLNNEVLLAVCFTPFSSRRRTVCSFLCAGTEQYTSSIRTFLKPQIVVDMI